jgi:hypothetical protein
MEHRRDVLKALAPLAFAQRAQLPAAAIGAGPAKLAREPFGQHRVCFGGAAGLSRQCPRG